MSPVELPLTARASGARARARLPRALSLIAAALGAAACSNDNSLLGPANFENVERVASVWALTGTAPALPAGFRFLSEQAVRPQMLATGAVNFDVAVELAPGNRVQLLPVRAVVPLPPAGASAIGMQLSTSTFDAVQRAPDKGYTADTTLVVGQGQLVLLQLPGAGCFYGEPFYAKMVVDSVVAAERRIVLRTLVNRNCGYRSLTTGIPKN